MINAIFVTISPSLLIVLLLFGIVFISQGGGLKPIIQSFLLGLFIIVPAIFTLRIIMVFFTITLPWEIPITIIWILSATNEEFFKLLVIKHMVNRYQKIIYSIFIGGGFAIGETLFLALGNPEQAIIRSYTTLPLHIVTSVILGLSIKKGRQLLFILAVSLHTIYNIFLIQ